MQTQNKKQSPQRNHLHPHKLVERSPQSPLPKFVREEPVDDCNRIEPSAIAELVHQRQKTQNKNVKGTKEIKFIGAIGEWTRMNNDSTHRSIYNESTLLVSRPDGFA